MHIQITDFGTAKIIEGGNGVWKSNFIFYDIWFRISSVYIIFTIGVYNIVLASVASVLILVVP